MPKELKSRLEKAHTLENFKKTLPNFVKILITAVVCLSFDVHTGTFDINVFDTILEKLEHYWEYIGGGLVFIYGQDFYRKRG